MLQRGQKGRWQPNAVHRQHRGSQRPYRRRRRGRTRGASGTAVGTRVRTYWHIAEGLGERERGLATEAVDRRQELPLVRVGVERRWVEKDSHSLVTTFTLERESNEVAEALPGQEVL